MATVPAKLDELSKDERAIVIAALDLKRASFLRASKAEANEAVREIRVRESAAIDALIARFR